MGFSLPWHQGGGAGWWGWRKKGGRRGKPAASSSSAQGGGQGSYFDRVKGLQGPCKAGLTSGSLSATGDLLAQALSARAAPPGEPVGYDPARTMRMLAYGLAFYGPYQYYWYALLEHLMPLKTTANFLAKVALNQLALAPVTTSAAFAWNLGLTGQGAALPAKLARDLLPTMMNGWKFWVPAASLNFYAVPLRQQVLWMSCCGVLWTAYLSHASATVVGGGGQVGADKGSGGGGGAAGGKEKSCCAGKKNK